MSSNNITVNPEQLADELMVCIDNRLVPYVTSSPGVGKSSIVTEVASAGNLKMIDLRLSQCTPEDLQGFPMRQGDKATFVPFDLFPLKGQELPELRNAKGEIVYEEDGTTPKRMNGWLLFLDELSSANKSVQAAAYKLVLDRMVGSFPLHEECYVVACGNKATDKAVVHQMSTALQSRLIHYELEVSAEEWIGWATKKGIDYRILGYLNFQPTKIMDFSPDHSDRTFACPRTWEFLSTLIKGQPIHEQKSLPRVAGTVGMGAAAEFLGFCDVFADLPEWKDIIDPKKSGMIDVPIEVSAKYAVISMIIARLEEKDLAAALQYVTKFTPDFEIIFCRGIISRFPKLYNSNKAFNTYAVALIDDLDRD